MYCISCSHGSLQSYAFPSTKHPQQVRRDWLSAPRAHDLAPRWGHGACTFPFAGSLAASNAAVWRASPGSPEPETELHPVPSYGATARVRRRGICAAVAVGSSLRLAVAAILMGLRLSPRRASRPSLSLFSSTVRFRARFRSPAMLLMTPARNLTFSKPLGHSLFASRTR
jgi:hypothetical protein